MLGGLRSHETMKYFLFDMFKPAQWSEFEEEEEESWLRRFFKMI
jgi:hypothetical protein